MNEFAAEQERQRGPGTTGWWVNAEQTLTPEQFGQLQEAADTPTISHRTISVVLERWGVKVTPGMVGHWRRNVR